MRIQIGQASIEGANVEELEICLSYVAKLQAAIGTLPSNQNAFKSQPSASNDVFAGIDQAIIDCIPGKLRQTMIEKFALEGTKEEMQLQMATMIHAGKVVRGASGYEYAKGVMEEIQQEESPIVLDDGEETY